MGRTRMAMTSRVATVRQRVLAILALGSDLFLMVAVQVLLTKNALSFVRADGRGRQWVGGLDHGWQEFTCESFEVRSRAGSAFAGVDCEALGMPTPLRFHIYPRHAGAGAPIESRGCGTSTHTERQCGALLAVARAKTSPVNEALEVRNGASHCSLESTARAPEPAPAQQAQRHQGGHAQHGKSPPRHVQPRSLRLRCTVVAETRRDREPSTPACPSSPRRPGARLRLARPADVAGGTERHPGAMAGYLDATPRCGCGRSRRANAPASRPGRR
jgi:hypothetical protein